MTQYILSRLPSGNIIWYVPILCVPQDEFYACRTLENLITARCSGLTCVYNKGFECAGIVQVFIHTTIHVLVIMDSSVG